MRNIESKDVRGNNGKSLICFRDAITKSLYRHYRPIDILDRNSSQEAINSMIETTKHFSPVEDYQTDDWSNIQGLLELASNYDKLDKETWDILLEPPDNKVIIPIIERFRNRKDLLKAWLFLLEPKFNIDFQFDQVCPIAKQSIDTRCLLKQKGSFRKLSVP